MSKNIKIFLSALIVFLICMFWCGRVNAVSYSLTTMESTNNLYCINHSGHMSHYVNANYNVVANISIIGNIATITRNGKTYKSNSYVHGQLAYILAMGNYKDGYGSKKVKGPRQLALWNVWNNWYETSKPDNQLGIKDLNLFDSANSKVSQTSESKRLISEATQYAIGKGGGQEPSVELISKKNTPIVTSEGKFYGPFRVKYNDTIQSIQIYDATSQLINRNVDICTSTTAKDAISKGRNNTFNGKSLPNNSDFYIYVKNDSVSVNSFKINVQLSKCTKVNIEVLKSATTVRGGTAQHLIKVTESTGTSGEIASVEIGFAEYTTLKLKKLDANDKHTLDGAKVILRHNNKCAIAEKTGDNYYEVTDWTSNEIEATRFEISSNGISIHIKRDENTLYALEEVEAPEGYAIGLGRAGNSDSVTDNTKYGDKYGLDGAKYYFDINSASIDASINLLNSKKVTLTIEKVNKNDTSQKLKGVEFYFKHNNQYAIVTGSGNYEVTGWTTDQNQASKIVTNEEGKIVISLAEDPQQKNNQYIYGLEETTSGSTINLREPKFISGNGTYKQNEDGYKLAFYLNYDYDSRQYKDYRDVSIVVGNEIPEEREVILRKVSSGNHSITINATFVIAHNNCYAKAECNKDGVWEIKEWLPYNLGEYTLDSKEVTKITLKNGEAKIKLPIDDKLYGFIETGTQNGYSLRMGYVAGESKNITPFDGTKKEWSKIRGIDSNGILNNWQDEDTGKNISEFFFTINKNVAANDGIKVCLTNDGGTGNLQKIVVKGRVWLDTPQGKDNVSNKIYDSGDESSPVRVTVSLVEKKTGNVGTYTYVKNYNYYDSEIGSYPSSVNTYGEFELQCNKVYTKTLRYYWNEDWWGYYNVDVITGYQSININDYYLKFEYNRTGNQQEGYTIYRPITYNSGDPEDVVRLSDYKNNSKAKSVSNTRDRYVAAIRDFNRYTDTCYRTSTERVSIYESRYSDYYYRNWTTTNITVGTLEYMNLGLKERKITGGDIVENLEYVRIVMPSQTSSEKNTYIYEYGSLYGDENRQGLNTGELNVMAGTPTVKYQNKTVNKYYTRPFYPSDIYRTLANNSNDSKMQVYVVYSITITNSEPMDGEICLEVLDLKNTYDTSRYTFSKETVRDISNNMVNTMQRDFGNWSDSNGTLTRKTAGETGDSVGHSYDGYSTNDDNYVCKINEKQSVTYYVQFKVKEDALKAILQHPGGIAEINPTKATARIRHYCRDYDEHYCDSEDCNGHSCRILEYSPERNISDDAPYMVFQIDNSAYDRTIQGTVFYDKENGSGDVVGNGQYDDGTDGTVSGVIVELRKSNANYRYDTEFGDGLFKGNEKELATIYYMPGNDSTKYVDESSKIPQTAKGVPAITKTDSSGHYSFTGVTPGDYFLVFKYPDGHEEYLKASNAPTENATNSETTGISINNVDQYSGMSITTPNYLKSTIVTNDKVQSAILSGDISEWYRKLKEKETNTKYSIAVDNLSLRAKLNKEQYDKLYGSGNAPTVKTMVAASAPFKIKIESSDKDNCSPDDIGVGDVNTYHSCDYSMFSFGIIRQAEQKASLEKVISNVKLTHDPQVIFDGNPQELTSQNVGVTDLDNKDNKGSTYTRVEIAQEALYGSTLTLTYELRVKNESENNYYDNDNNSYGYWYMFGTKDDNNKVTLSVCVDDYLDKYLTYEGNTNNAKGNTLTGYDAERKAIIKTYYTKDYTSTSIFKLVDNVNNSGISEVIDENETLMYELQYANKIKKGDTETVSLNASKLLSGREEEWNYQNSAEIKTLVNRTSEGNASNKDKTEEKRSVDLVITPEKLNNPNVKIEEKHYPNTEIVITTPTGMDKQSKTLYIITGVVSLIVLCGGIIIIKKKVL